MLIPDELMVVQLVKKFPDNMGSKIILPSSEEPLQNATLSQFNPYHIPIPCVFKINF
jgi:hypothetical protein